MNVQGVFGTDTNTYHLLLTSLGCIGFMSGLAFAAPVHLWIY
jgi:hypothetical protein